MNKKIKERLLELLGPDYPLDKLLDIRKDLFLHHCPSSYQYYGEKYLNVLIGLALSYFSYLDIRDERIKSFDYCITNLLFIGIPFVLHFHVDSSNDDEPDIITKYHNLHALNLIDSESLEGLVAFNIDQNKNSEFTDPVHQFLADMNLLFSPVLIDAQENESIEFLYFSDPHEIIIRHGPDLNIKMKFNDVINKLKEKQKKVKLMFFKNYYAYKIDLLIETNSRQKLFDFWS